MTDPALQLSTQHAPADRPVLVWDGRCGWCAKVVARLRYQVGDRLDDTPYQDAVAAGRFPDIPTELFARATHLIETDGRVLAGAAAIFRARALGQGGAAGWWCYRRVPLFAAVAEAVYGLIARHRAGAARASRWLIGRDLLPAQHRLTRWLFLRLLGVTVLCAFLSMYVQADGLFGEEGILPAADFMAQVDAHADRMEQAGENGNPDGWSSLDRYLRVPTVLWLGASDGWLQLWMLLGILLAVLLILDIAPGPVLLGLWVIYLSLITAGNIFFLYQWDALLLETLFVAMLFAPWRRVRPRLSGDRQPSRAGLWLVRLVLFKLMFMSGAVKLLAHDHTWTELTALQYHYFTQPIPSWTAYYAHHLPDWMHAACTVIMFAIELILPFLIFAPRRLRLVSFAGTVLLMVLISATGNFGFFNLLTVVLAISLLDDSALRRVTPARLRRFVPDLTVPPPVVHRIARGVIIGFAVVIVWVSSVQIDARFDRDSDRSRFTAWLMERVAPYHSINGYGLFANMTTERPEIVIEGSRDGIAWEAYELVYKPGALDRRPPWIGPHMPRLDWQMWFAALRVCHGAHWFHPFMKRLLDGAPAVRALLAHDPFGDDPPRFLRSTTYRYEFADLDSPDWWKRTRVGPFCPTVTLQDGRLVRAE